MTPLIVLQVVVVVGGTVWCMALASTAFFGGWYAHTHPTTGNDQVMRWLARLVRFLTFGLTDAPFPDLESDAPGQEAEKEQDLSARVQRQHVRALR